MRTLLLIHSVVCKAQVCHSLLPYLLCDITNYDNNLLWNPLHPPVKNYFDWVFCKTMLRALHRQAASITWSKISYDRHRVDHVIHPHRFRSVHGWAAEIRVSVLKSDFFLCCNFNVMRWVLTVLIRSSAWLRHVVSLLSAWNARGLRIFKVLAPLTRPVVWYEVGLFQQAVEGSFGVPLTVGLSALCKFKKLLVVFLPQISPCQRPEWGWSRGSSVPHSLPRERGHRWRYNSIPHDRILQQQYFPDDHMSRPLFQPGHWAWSEICLVPMSRAMPVISLSTRNTTAICSSGSSLHSR